MKAYTVAFFYNCVWEEATIIAPSMGSARESFRRTYQRVSHLIRNTTIQRA